MADTPISGLDPLSRVLQDDDLAILSQFTIDGWKTAKVSLGELKVFFLFNIGLGEIVGLVDALNNKAEINHTHTIANVTGLQTALDGKAASNHVHTIGQVNGLQVRLETIETGLSDKSDIGHTHPIASILGLQDQLNNKSELDHVHPIEDVAGLQAIITSIQNNLNNKSDLAHIHEMSDITGLVDVLASKLGVGEEIAIDLVTGLQDALNQKVNSDLIGQPNGIAELGPDGLLKAEQRPTVPVTLLFYNTFASLPNVGTAGRLYVDEDSGVIYRWDGSGYQSIGGGSGSGGLVLGNTFNTAFRGDYGLVAYNHANEPHAPADAQKNSDITKQEIEDRLVGDIDTHSHPVESITGLDTVLIEYVKLNPNGKIDINFLPDGIGNSEIDTLTQLVEALNLRVDTHDLSIDGIDNQINLINQTINNMVNDLNDKAEVNHTHEINEVNGLQALFSDYQTDLADVENLANSAQSALQALEMVVSMKANVVHTHQASEISGLTNLLNQKANVNHTHEINEVNGLQTALGQKADTNHTHPMSSVTGLQGALTNLDNAKANVFHQHPEYLTSIQMLSGENIENVWGRVAHGDVINTSIIKLQKQIDLLAMLNTLDPAYTNHPYELEDGILIDIEELVGHIPGGVYARDAFTIPTGLYSVIVGAPAYPVDTSSHERELVTGIFENEFSNPEPPLIFGLNIANTMNHTNLYSEGNNNFGSIVGWGYENYDSIGPYLFNGVENLHKGGAGLWKSGSIVILPEILFTQDTDIIIGISTTVNFVDNRGGFVWFRKLQQPEIVDYIWHHIGADFTTDVLEYNVDEDNGVLVEGEWYHQFTARRYFKKRDIVEFSIPTLPTFTDDFTLTVDLNDTVLTGVRVIHNASADTFVVRIADNDLGDFSNDLPIKIQIEVHSRYSATMRVISDDGNDNILVEETSDFIYLPEDFKVEVSMTAKNVNEMFPFRILIIEAGPHYVMMNNDEPFELNNGDPFEYND